MFSVNGKTLLEDDLHILSMLQSEIYNRTGITFLGKFIVSDTDIQFCCPFHSNGQEKRPSCGITRVEKGTGKNKIPAGTVHCFTCGATTSLENMVSYLFGFNDEGIYGSKWLISKFLSVEIEDRKDIRLEFNRYKADTILKKYVSEKELDRYRYIHPYMYKRGMTDDLIEKFDIGYDPAFKLKKGEKTFPCITFPVRDKQGNTLFIARRAIDFKLYHYPEGVDKPLYGVYELDYSKNTLVVCESIINAITATKYRDNAIALLGTGAKNQYDLIKKLPFRYIIAAFDGDEAGERGAYRLIKNLPNKLVKALKVPQGKDINDLTEEEYNNLPEYFLSKRY